MGVIVRVLTWPPVTVITDVMGVADQVKVLEDGVLDVDGVGVSVSVGVGVGVGEGVGCEVEVCSKELGEEDEV